MNSNSVPRAIPDIDRWFNSEISRWRSGAALVWTILLVGPIVYGTIGIASISLLHPISWIVESILRVLTPWTWMYILIVIVMVAILTVQHAKQQKVVAVVHRSRWEKLVSVLRVRSVYTVCTSSVLSAIITWCYAKLVTERYNNLSTPCQHQNSEVCLNEYHLYIVLHGMYVGMAYRMTALLSGHSHMTFPIVQQSKFFQLKSSAISMVWTSLWITVNRLKYFVLVYFIALGSLLKTFLATNIGLVQSDTVTPVNSVSGLLDMRLIWHCVLSGVLVYSLLTLGANIHQLYHTEWFQFQVETPVEQYRNLCLPNALRCEHNNLVQYHGYQDLYLLSKHSLSRRQQLFCLTQLGGHPHNWQLVSKECLHLLRTFIEDVSAYNTRIMANGSMKQLNTEKAPVTADLRHRLVSGEQSVLADCKTKKHTFMESIISDMKKNHVVAFFLHEDEDASSRRLFAKAQLYIWVVEAFSYLVCASFEEDKFGVVQKSLPDIMETLLGLQEQVEKHFRLVPNIGKRSERDEARESDSALRGALKVTLKVAIYRIVSKFGTHIRSVPLSSEHMRRLNHFLEYKE